MKKRIGTYAVCWAILLAVFQIICFVVPDGIMAKSGSAFWVGYLAVTWAFLGQLVCAYFALQADSTRKLFYHLPLITISYSGLGVTLLCGMLCMLIPGLPVWIAVIVCLLVLAFTAVAVIKANAAAEAVEQTDARVQQQTRFIRALTVQAEGLVNRAGREEIRTACRNVRDVARYSDPMSRTELADVESRIAAQMETLTAAVAADDPAQAAAAAAEVTVLLQERNDRCRLLK